MAVTIYDVARKAAVSTATVSKVLSHSPHISEGTRARVLAVVEELGYVPSLAARGLSKARTYIIGLCFPYVADYLFGDPHLLAFMRGVEHIAAENEFSLLLLPARSQAGAGSGLERLLHTQYVDGAIIVGMRAGEEAGVDFSNLSFPIVSLGYRSPAGEGNTVHADDRRGALLATRHLIQLGHRRIGIINAAAPLTALDERLAGYRSALEEARLHFDPLLMVEGDFTEASGAHAAHQLLSLPRPPTAIFAFNDRMAIGAIQFCRQHDIPVPHKIAVVGFDDIPAACLVEPALTTVRQPALEMGNTAARMLLGLIEGKIEQFPAAVLPALLVVRESCGQGEHKTPDMHAL